MDPSTSSVHAEGHSPVDQLTEDWLFLSHDSVRPQELPEVRELPEAQELPEAEDRGRLRSKLLSAWNSVKYAGWTLKQKSKFSKNSPVMLLGKPFDLRDPGQKECFRSSFVSLLYLTYRRGFSPLIGCSLTSDSGWGCVLRTGQMLLGQGLVLHLLPSGWTWSATHHEFKDDMDLESRHARRGRSFKDGVNPRARKLSLGSLLDRPTEPAHRRVVSWFLDHPSAPFGIHQLVELGRSSGKKAGDWYSPSIVAHILQKAVAASADLPNLVVYVAQDCTVYVEDVRSLCERPHPQPWKSVLLLVPVRLGGQDLNPAYVACVKKLLTLECCIGIIGGKPKHSLFFVGFQDDNLLYLDPHYCQPTVDVTKKNFPLESFHCKYPRKMPVSRMDPCCTIGFYASSQKDFESLRTVVGEALSTSAETYPMFIFTEGQSREEARSITPTNTTNTTNTTFIHRRRHHRREETSNSLDEFVLL